MTATVKKGKLTHNSGIKCKTLTHHFTLYRNTCLFDGQQFSLVFKFKDQKKTFYFKRTQLSARVSQFSHVIRAPEEPLVKSISFVSDREKWSGHLLTAPRSSVSAAGSLLGATGCWQKTAVLLLTFTFEHHSAHCSPPNSTARGNCLTSDEESGNDCLSARGTEGVFYSVFCA